MNRSEQRLGVLAGTGAYALWGLFPLYFHALEPASAPEILAHRIVWSFLLMCGVLTVTRRWPGVTALRRNPRRLAATWGAGVLLAVNWLVYVWAVNVDRVVDASMGYFVNPLLTVLLGVVLLGESLRRAQRVAIGFGAAAVIVLTIGYGEVPWIAGVLAATFATYGYLKKRVGLDPVAALTAETAVVVPFAAVGLAIAVTTGHATFAAHGDGGGVGLDAMLIGLGPVTSAPLLLFGAATRRIPLVTVGLLQYLTPWLQFLLGWIYFGEDMPVERLAGFALIWIALGILVVDTVRTGRGAVPVMATATDPGQGNE